MSPQEQLRAEHETIGRHLESLNQAVISIEEGGEFSAAEVEDLLINLICFEETDHQSRQEDWLDSRLDPCSARRDEPLVSILKEEHQVGKARLDLAAETFDEATHGSGPALDRLCYWLRAYERSQKIHMNLENALFRIGYEPERSAPGHPSPTDQAHLFSES